MTQSRIRLIIRGVVLIGQAVALLFGATYDPAVAVGLQAGAELIAQGLFKDAA